MVDGVTVLFLGNAVGLTRVGLMCNEQDLLPTRGGVMNGHHAERIGGVFKPRTDCASVENPSPPPINQIPSDSPFV